jgi:hypothetical protein
MSTKTDFQQEVLIWDVTGKRHTVPGGIPLLKLMNEADDWLAAGDKNAPISRGAKLVLLTAGTKKFGRAFELWWMCQTDEDKKLLSEVRADAKKKAKR